MSSILQPRGRVARIAVWSAAALLFATVVTASAQDASGDPPPAPPQVDIRDVWHHVRGRMDFGIGDTIASPSGHPFIVFAPTISSKPSTGLSLGMGTTFAFVDGDPDTTRLSSAAASVKVSMKQQAASSIRFGVFTDSDRWFIQGDNRFQWTSLNTYPIGGDSLNSSGSNLKYDWFRIYETAYRQVAPHLFVGAGINVNDHANVRAASGSLDASAYAAYSAAHGFATNQQTSAGTSVGVLFDTRDNSINPRRGWLASSVYRTFVDGLLGGDSSWQELNVEARTYHQFTPRQTLALWFLGDLVTGGTAPYFDLPGTATDMYGRASRGYAEGRYRGPHLLYGEVEYRATVVPSGLLGVVAFANTATISGTTPQQRLFQSFAPATGGGLRVLLDKRSRTNLAVDYGWGRGGSRGLYLGMQEAF